VGKGGNSINDAIASFHSETSSLISAMRAHAAQCDDEVKRLLSAPHNYSIGELSEQIEKLNKVLLGNEPSILEHRYPPESLNSLTHPVREAAALIERELADARRRLDHKLSSELTGRESLRTAVKQSSARAGMLADSIEQVSGSVLRFQRVGFYSKDYFLPAIFLFGTLGLAAWRLFEKLNEVHANIDIPAWICAGLGVLFGLIILLLDQRRIGIDAQTRKEGLALTGATPEEV
jgi:hypothetical protein